MSEQDVTVETVETPQTTQDVTVETPEADKGATPPDEGTTQAEQPEETVETLKRAKEAMQLKIDRQTAAFRDLQRTLEQRNKEYQEFQARMEQSKPLQEPKIDDYETHQDYVNALADYRADLKIKESQSKQLEAQRKQAEMAAQQKMAEIESAQKAEYLQINPRYEASEAEFYDYLRTTKINPDVANAIRDVAFKGNICQLVDYFGSNSGERIPEFEKISRMSPVEAAIEIYKLQQTLGTPKKREEKQAPKPAKSLAGTGKSSKSLADMDGKDILKWVKKR